MKILTIILISVFMLSCSENSEEIIEKNIPVTISKIDSAEFSIPIITSGKLSSNSEKMLSFKTGGIVSNIFFNEGEYVKKGEVIAKLNLSEIQSKVNKAKAAFEKSERDLERIKSLYKDSVATLEQLQNLTTVYNVAKADFESAEFNLSFSVIRAPENGKILKKIIEVNEMVSPGKPIVIFGSSDGNWKIKTNITDMDITKIALGDKAEISIDAYPNYLLNGKVHEIGGAANPYSGTYEAEISLEDTKLNLISGMFGIVKIIPSNIEKKLLIPIDALVNAEDERADIYTINNEEFAERVNISIGQIYDDDKVIVNDSLNFDIIIVDGVEYLTDGAKIKVIKKDGKK